MAKKQKRQVARTAAPVAREPISGADAGTTSTSSASRYPVSYNRPAGVSTEFNPDYSFVIKDLKRIGVLAGSFIVILVALSFFLR